MAAAEAAAGEGGRQVRDLKHYDSPLPAIISKSFLFLSIPTQPLLVLLWPDCRLPGRGSWQSPTWRIRPRVLNLLRRAAALPSERVPTL